MKKIVAICLSFSLLLQPAFADDLLDVLGEDTESEELFVTNDEISVALKTSLKKPSAEQNILIQFIAEKKYDKALYQWWSAFERSSFQKTDTGKTVFSFLLAKNGLDLIALEHFFTVKSPEKVDSKLTSVLKTHFNLDHEVWKYADVNWNGKWSQFFSDSIYFKNLSYKSHKFKSSKEVLSLLRRTHVKDDQESWLKWQLGLHLAVEGDTVKSAKVISHLLKKGSGVVSKDLIHITIARILYERGFLKAANKYYSKVEKESPFWFTAQEEMAWSYLRQGQPQNTLAVTKTLSQKIFDGMVGAESYMLRALSQVKVCNYYGAIETTKGFSRIFKNRYQKMKGLSESVESSSVTKLLSALEKQRVSWRYLKADLANIPSYSIRDEFLFNNQQAFAFLKKEIKIVDDLYAKSLAEGTATVGYQASIQGLKNVVSARSAAIKNASLNRIKKLAQQEMEEIKLVLQKMHIIEAEVIQQISVASKALKAKVHATNIKKGSTGSKNRYAMKFPFEGEIWADEISNYRVDIKKACQSKKGK